MVQPGKSWTYLPVSTIPSALDIVWCNFPTTEDPRLPSATPHPGLIRSVVLNKSHDKALVEITFGTSKLKIEERPLDLIIQNSASLDHCGLPKATRFDLDRTVTLPWAEEFFVVREGYNSRIIGSLDNDTRMQLEALKVLRRKPLRG